MGYCATQGETKFFIAADAASEVFAAVQHLSTLGKSYHWVDNLMVTASHNLTEALSQWGWYVRTDNDGNVIDLSWEWTKPIEEDVLFTAIAPWVRDGSYITMIGEDGYQWRWVFQHGVASRLKGVVTFQ